MWKDVNVLYRDWAAIILIIAGPLVLTVGLGLVTGSFGADDNAPTIGEIPVLIVDEDDGQLATALIDVFTSEDLSELVAPELWNDAPTAQEEVRNGDAAAVIVIPAGFSDSFRPDTATGALPEPVTLQVYGDPGSPIGAGVVRSIAEEFAARAATNVAAVQIALTELARSGAVSPADLPAVGQAMGEQLLGGDESTATASLIRVRAESTATSGEGGFNALAYFAPAMALLFLMYAVTLGARTLLSERREGTLARMMAAPVTPAQVLGGKIAGIFLGGFIQLAALIALTTILFRLNWGDPLGVFLLVFAAALAATGWGLLIASASTNSGQISNMGMALTLIFGILGGSFVPNLQMGSVMDWLSRITPNRWAMDGFIALASGEGLSAVLLPVSALLLMAVILFAVSAALFRRRQTALLTA
jgi:ABC-2 type transport system permease protein